MTKSRAVIITAIIYCIFAASLSAQDVRVRAFSKYELNNISITSTKNKTGMCSVNLNNGIIEASYNEKHEKGKDLRLFNGDYSDYSVTAANDTRVIPGRLEARILPGEKGIVLISTMDIEDYVPCVLSSELDAALYKTELAKAFAITIRSFATYNNKRHPDYDFCDLTHCEVFKGEPAQRAMWYGPVKQTKGIIFSGDCAKESVYFSACCGGFTENAGEFSKGKAGACGQSKPDIYNGKNLCEGHRYFRWTKVISKADTENALADFTDEKQPDMRDIIVTEKTSSGRVKTLGFIYNSRGVEKHISLDVNKYFSVFGKKAGWALIPSKAFEIEKQGNVYILKGRGHGHGVGLCVQGASMLAGMGKGYEEILKFYFPDLGLKQNY
jgi:stage II sporulation protein D